MDPNFLNPRISNLTGSIEHTFAKSWIATVTFAWANSQHLRTGGYGTEEAWYRNFTSDGVDQFGRAILTGLLDPTLASFTNITASYARGNYESAVFNLTKRFSNHFQLFANYIWSQNKDNGASERDTDTFFGQQDPFNIGLDYGRNGLDIKHQFKLGGVYELPMGFAASATVIAHTGVPFPLYINTDINGDGVANSGFSHNNDRPSLLLSNGNAILVGRYPYNQPGFAELDARIQKDFKLSDRYHVLLSGDFYNLTNRGNVYSDPDTGNAMPSTTARIARLRTPAPPGGRWACQLHRQPDPGSQHSARPRAGARSTRSERRGAGLHQSDRTRQHSVCVPSRSQIHLLMTFGPGGRRRFLQGLGSSVMLKTAAGGNPLRQAAGANPSGVNLGGVKSGAPIRWPKPIGSPVLDSLRPVIENSRDVHTHVDKIVEVAGWMAYEELPMPEYHVPAGVGVNDPNETIDFIMVADVIDTAFTDFTTHVKFTTEYAGQHWSDSEAGVRVPEACEGQRDSHPRRKFSRKGHATATEWDFLGQHRNADARRKAGRASSSGASAR